MIRDDVLDTHPHGTIDMHDGLVHSCNAYFAQLAVRVGPRSILDTANLLGISVARDDSWLVFARRCHRPATVRATSSPRRFAWREWPRRSPAAASSATPGSNNVASGSSRTVILAQVLLTPGAASTLGRYLRDAVLNGTGRSLREHPWRIAGKTGTAEVHDAQSHAWFVGYAPYGPAEKRVAFAVLIENAGYGGLGGGPCRRRDRQRRRGEWIDSLTRRVRPQPDQGHAMDILGKARKLESKLAQTFDRAAQQWSKSGPRGPLEILHGDPRGR